jgi:hypothetical protein
LEVSLDRLVSVESLDLPDISLSPIPFDAYLIVNIEMDGVFYLYSISGELRKCLTLRQGLNRIPTENLEKGGYLVRIIFKNEVYNKLIIK